jgi:hypothetical protein
MACRSATNTPACTYTPTPGYWPLLPSPLQEYLGTSGNHLRSSSQPWQPVGMLLYTSCSPGSSVQ